MSEFKLYEPDGWTAVVAGFQQERSDDGRTVTLRGTCSLCSDEMSVDLAIEDRTGRKVDNERNNQKLDAKAFVKVAYCNCVSDHDKRPADRAGCGAFGALEIGSTAAADAQGKYVAVEPAADKATLTDLQWEWLAAKQRVDELSTTRTAGEKWATAITTLTGVFSIVVLIKGPEDVTDVVGKVGTWLPETAATALWLPLMIVLGIAFVLGAIMGGINRGAWVAGPLAFVAVWCFALLFLGRREGSYVIGDGWWMVVFLLTAITLVAIGIWSSWRPVRPILWVAALVCVVLAGFALGQGLALWETVIVVSLGCAIVLAGLSIVAGARAAYGPVYVTGAPSGALLRDRQRIEVSRSRRWLLLAIYPAVCAVGFIALAIAVTWLRTPDKPAPGNLLVLRQAPAAPLCGTMERHDGTKLFLRIAKPPKEEPVPWTDVRALTVVASCPSPGE